MNPSISAFAEDMHVPVPRSRERAILSSVIPWAQKAGINRLGLVAKAGARDFWVPDFASAVRATPAPPELEVLVGIEVEILDEEGRLDLPPGLGTVDFLLAEDSVLPTSVGRLDAPGLKEKLAAGQISALQIVREIVSIYMAVMNRHPGLVLARPFSMLRRLGIREDWIGEDTLRALSRAALDSGCAMEVNERWRCPEPATVRVFIEEDVPLVFGTEAQGVSAVGDYKYAILATASLPSRKSDCSASGPAIGSSHGLRAAS